MWKKLLSGRVREVFLIALAFSIGASMIAWAAQTNYLGTVFIADTTTPANQLSVNSSGGMEVTGDTASGATDAGNPVKIGGIYVTSPTAKTTGQRVDASFDSRGNLHVVPCTNDGNTCAFVSAPSTDGASSANAAVFNLSFNYLYNGSTFDRAFTCTSQAQVTVTAAATTEIVALGASQVIRVCSFSVGMSASGTAKFVQGTGTNCGTGTADITPATNITSGNVWALSAGNNSVLRTGSGNALCVTAATGNAQVFVSYAKY